MKIALAQLNYIIGDFEGNASKIIEHIHIAKERGADLIVFAELCVCGYPPRDFLEFDHFIQQSYQSVVHIASHCKGIAAIVGAPSVNPATKGKSLYNSAYFLQDGQIHSVVHKTLLPNYDVFDEYRYFEPNRLPYQVIEYKGHRIALTICEDLWNISDDLLYIRNPMEELVTMDPTLIINISASPFHIHQPKQRLEVLARNAVTYSIPVIYVNHVGGQTELLFDGGSLVVKPDGNPTMELNRFREDFGIWDTKKNAEPVSQSLQKANMEEVELIYGALLMGIHDYFVKMRFARAILGLSGGIDSAVTLVLAVQALGESNVHALLLPSRFSSEHSITDAAKLSDNIHVSYDIIKIDEPYETLEKALSPWFENLPFDLAEENIQARLRAMILMAFANKFGYILLNTSNKSEAAVGYGTLYGDMCGGLSVLGDVYKTHVYDLARFINRDREIIPASTIAKPPSAELRPDQLDSDSLPEYSLLDKILSGYIEERKGPDELIRDGFDEATVRKVLRLVNTNEWKRYQTPPILRISPKAFGSGRRMPIVARYLG